MDIRHHLCRNHFPKDRTSRALCSVKPSSVPSNSQHEKGCTHVSIPFNGISRCNPPLRIIYICERCNRCVAQSRLFFEQTTRMSNLSVLQCHFPMSVLMDFVTYWSYFGRSSNQRWKNWSLRRHLSSRTPQVGVRTVEQWGLHCTHGSRSCTIRSTSIATCPFSWRSG